MNKGINVLSLCDGISGCQVSLGRANIDIKTYISSEINNDSIAVTTDNFPNTIQIGDMETLLSFDEYGKLIIYDKLINLQKIDIITAGTPCQGISKSKPIRENLKDVRSRLFFNFVEIYKWLKVNNNPNILFLLENVVPNKETLKIMNEYMGCDGIMINSELVAAQRRKRMYWTNINDGNIPMPKQKNIKIKDIIYDDKYKVFIDNRCPETRIFTKNYVKWDISGKGYYSQQYRGYYKNGVFPTIPSKTASDKLNIWLGEYTYRRCHPIEAERAQTLPDNYTSCIKSHPKRLALCGDGWTIDIIAHIFSFLPKEWRLEEKSNEL